MADIISAGFLGFLLGALIMAVGLKKDVDRTWDEAFKAGEQYGAESAEPVQERALTTRIKPRQRAGIRGE
jgi:hypothetical protein